MKALSLLGIVGLFLLVGSVPADAQVINEILADPLNAPGGDANGDNNGGDGHFSQDEFVEIVNNTGADVDLSGWEIQDNGNPVHVFPAGTVVADQCAIVVFGGGTPTGAFGGAVVQTSSSGNLSLSNGGATITLVNTVPATVDSVTYPPPPGGDNQSLTRDPDITGGFVLHTAAAGAGGAIFSPGTLVDGSQFSGCPELSVVINEIHADPAGDISGDANGDGVRNSSQDEFVEIFNNTGQIWPSDTLPHFVSIFRDFQKSQLLKIKALAERHILDLP